MWRHDRVHLGHNQQIIIGYWEKLQWMTNIISLFKTAKLDIFNSTCTTVLEEAGNESFYYVLVFKKWYFNIFKHYPDPSLLTVPIGNKILFCVLFEAHWLSGALSWSPHLPPWGLTAVSLSGLGLSILHVWFAVFISVKVRLSYETQTADMWQLTGVPGKVWVIVIVCVWFCSVAKMTKLDFVSPAISLLLQWKGGPPLAAHATSMVPQKMYLDQEDHEVPGLGDKSSW